MNKSYKNHKSSYGNLLFSFNKNNLKNSLAAEQKGVALLLVLLLVVAITVVAGVMLARQQFAVRQAGLLFEQNKMRQQLDLSQQLAAELIRNDGEVNDYDSLQDVWAKPIPPISGDGYERTIQIADASATFNLNNLYQNGEVNTQAFNVFERLLSLLQLDTSLAVAVLDWQDTDAEVYLDGGDEAVVYDAFANQPFIDIEQLTNIKGFDKEAMVKLRPHISAMPVFVPINVNTATPLLLQAVFSAKADNNGTDSANSNNGENNETANNSNTVKVTEQVDLPGFKQNPVTTSEELWELPEIKAIDESVVSNAKQLSGVVSTGFNVLVAATDAKGRSKYRTVNIVRIDVSSQQNATNNTAVTNNPSNTANQNQTGNNLKVGVLNQREWAFEPRFEKQPTQ